MRVAIANDKLPLKRIGAKPASRVELPPTPLRGVLPVAPGYDLTHVPLHSARTPAVQAKLTVNQPGDVHEQEADRAAADVMTKGTSPRAVTAPVHISRSLSGSSVGRRASQEPHARAQQGALGSVEEALRSPGQPLGLEARHVMEPRFGRSFADVRVHTHAAGEHSAWALQAEAYTVGNNIVFGSGRFAPETPGGKHLLAHELAHVVQQTGQSGRAIQRKELNAPIVGSLRTPAPQDWYYGDREAWEAASHTGTEAQLDPQNTFMRAAWYNTVQALPSEYQTIRERHDYYDLISYVIEHDPHTPPAARDVRFFHATTAVTGSPGIGTVDTAVGLEKLGPDTRQIMRDVNAELFALNVGMIRNLLSTWKEPRDPQTPQGKIGAFEFDIRMVETEQGLVETYIAKNKAKFTLSVVGDINATLDPSAFGQWFNFSQRSFEWALKALGVLALDFTNRDHRQAIGFASVHIFHRKSKDDYLAFMKTRVPTMKPAAEAPKP